MTDSNTEPTLVNAAVQAFEKAKLASHALQDLNAWAYVDWDDVALRAQALDSAAQARANAGLAPLRLNGMSIGIKDLFNVDGMPTKAGTRARLPSLGSTQASLVNRLKAQGALIVGKTNMHEVALGGTGENSWTGDVKNPIDPAHQAGGSSSGSAVAVACGMVRAAIGTDTGGSIRVPAAFCGVVGFKPSHGVVPVDGGLVLAYSFDHAGPMTKNVADARLLYEVLSGLSASHARPPKRLRLGVPRSWNERRLASDMSADFADALNALRVAGVEIVDIDADAPLACAWKNYTNMTRAEGAQVHREVLQEVLAKRAAAQTGSAEASFTGGFSESVLQPLLAGLSVTASDYVHASREREQGRRQLALAMQGVDALITTSSAVYPPRRGQTEIAAANDTMMPVREAVLGQTLAFSFYGLPTLSIPVKNKARKFPLGLQLVGHAAQDAIVLAIGQMLETALETILAPSG